MVRLERASPELGFHILGVGWLTEGCRQNSDPRVPEAVWTWPWRSQDRDTKFFAQTYRVWGEHVPKLNAWSYN